MTIGYNISQWWTSRYQITYSMDCVNYHIFEDHNTVSYICFSLFVILKEVVPILKRNDLHAWHWGVALYI